MVERIEQFLKDLTASLQISKIYTTDHPTFHASLDRAYENLQAILRERPELVIGIVGDEFAFEKEIFFEFSKHSRAVIDYLKQRDIEKISFNQGVLKDELAKLISLLSISLKEFFTLKGQSADISDYMSRTGVRNITVGKLKAETANEQIHTNAAAYLKQYEGSLAKVSSYVDTVINGAKVDYLGLKFSTLDVMENLIGRYNDFFKLSAVKKYDVGTFTHLLNVAILSMCFSSKLSFAREDVSDIGTAALFHDVGKIYISKRIVLKPDRLVDEEFAKIKSHTILGAELLLRYVDALGILPVVVAYEHHLGFSQKGYPKLSFPQKPNISSLIVSICDVYDALNQKRTYKRDYPPDMIYSIMMKEKGVFFDPELLDEFFKTIGVWPPGTIVVLSDRRVAVVRETNEDDIFSPNIEVVPPVQEKQLLDLRREKERTKIERSLNPLKEGMEYLHFV